MPFDPDKHLDIVVGTAAITYTVIAEMPGAQRAFRPAHCTRYEAAPCLGTPPLSGDPVTVKTRPAIFPERLRRMSNAAAL